MQSLNRPVARTDYGFWARVGHFRSHTWVKFLIRRVISLAFILIVLVFATFIMVRLIPGDPGRNALGISVTDAQVRLLDHQLGLDQPIPVQFARYGFNLLHGNLGTSFTFDGEPVNQLISQRIGSSLQLASTSLVVLLLVSIPAGMLAGGLTKENRHRWWEVAFIGSTSVFGAIPEYVTGTFLAFVFAVTLRLLPVAGADEWQSLVLPVAAISIRPIAILTRLVRVETINVLASDYVRTARSKRLPAYLLYYRHVLPNVLTGALTVGGSIFADLIGGAVVVENVFNRVGLGTALVAAVLGRDYTVIQGIILLLGATVVIVNAAVDVLLALVNPRSISAQA